jgi:hypothetical protein
MRVCFNRLESNTKTAAASDPATDEIILVQPQSTSFLPLQNVKLPPPIWASLATTPRQAGSAKTEPLPTENTDASSSVPESTLTASKACLPDYGAWKLKIESLTTERKYLVHENGILKQRIDEVFLSTLVFAKLVLKLQAARCSTFKIRPRE